MNKKTLEHSNLIPQELTLVFRVTFLLSYVFPICVRIFRSLFFYGWTSPAGIDVSLITAIFCNLLFPIVIVITSYRSHFLRPEKLLILTETSLFTTYRDYFLHSSFLFSFSLSLIHILCLDFPLLLGIKVSGYVKVFMIIEFIGGCVFIYVFGAHLSDKPARILTFANTFFLLKRCWTISSLYLFVPITNELANRRVFIGHGRSKCWEELRDFIKDLGLECDEFNHVPAAGLSTNERLQQMLKEADMAFLVMTAEDKQADGTLRARQNVVHELGLFQSKLGSKRAIIMLEEGCEEFTNIQGLIQIRFPKEDIGAAFKKVRSVLRREEMIK